MALNKAMLSLRVRQTHPNPVSAEFECVGGEVLALVGPSGSGKSSLLRLIAGLSRPEEGQIIYRDSKWLDTTTRQFFTPQARGIGYVPQHYGLFPHMSAIENIKAGLTHLTQNEQQRIAMEWLDRVQLNEIKDRRPSQLSGGQQQRVAVARALARNPSVLLLDEPFSAIDGVAREDLYLQLAELKQQLSIPIIMVTHDLNEAVLLADRMALLLNGRVLQVGTPEEVIAHPINEQAAKQVGIRSFFDGQVVDHDVHQKITWLRAGKVTLATPYRPEIKAGAVVRWVIPHAGVRLRAMFHTELAQDYNRIVVTVEELVPLGSTIQLKARMEGITSFLHTYLPKRLAAELRLAPGGTTSVILRQEMVHILDA